MTSPNPDWALIIHADSADTRVDVYWVDIRAGRLGLALAKEVKAWRKRDDLLTLGQRFRVVDGPTGGPGPPVFTSENEGVELVIPLADQLQDVQPHQDDQEPEQDIIRVDPSHDDSPTPVDVPALAPVVPQDGRRVQSRHDWLRARVAAVVGHSETAAFALQRTWPQGIPGLKQDGHSMDDLDAIQSAVEKVEKDHSVPFYPSWDDPDIDDAITHHPSYSDRWARPETITDEPSSADSVAARLSIQQAIMDHPRRRLLSTWVSAAISGGINSKIDTTALAHALFEFAKVDEATWPDDALTEMLEGCLRTLGYPNGIRDLGNFDPPKAPVLMSMAFAIAAGTATILYDDQGTSTVITDVIGKPL
jgi:hypothetical protein